MSGLDPGPYRSGGLLDAAHAVALREPAVTAALAPDLPRVRSDGGLVASVLSAAAPPDASRAIVREAVEAAFDREPALFEAAITDLRATYSKDGEPGGVVTTLLFARGYQAITGHRVANHFWRAGKRELAFMLKTIFGRAFSTDVHPGATFGSGVWLDHGVAFVAGETAVIEDDVSIWHGVTLGSNLRDLGPARHPRLAKGCTIGAGAIILGRTTVGEGAVVAAGSVVLRDVAPFTTVAGSPAQVKQRREGSFAGFASPERNPA